MSILACRIVRAEGHAHVVKGIKKKHGREISTTMLKLKPRSFNL